MYVCMHACMYVCMCVSVLIKKYLQGDNVRNHPIDADFALMSSCDGQEERKHDMHGKQIGQIFRGPIGPSFFFGQLAAWPVGSSFCWLGQKTPN